MTFEGTGPQEESGKIMHTRREFGKIALAGLPLAVLMTSSGLDAGPANLDSTVRGVKLGLITGSLGGGGGAARGATPGGQPPAPPAPLTVDAIIAACIEIGAANVEYSGPTPGMPRLLDSVNFGQPPTSISPAYANTREAVRQWRMTASLDPLIEARKKFADAGLNWFSGVETISDDYTDEEIDVTFERLQAMGVKYFCTNQTRVSAGPRLVPFAEKYNISPAWHTHDKSVDTDEVASKESLEKLLAMSPRFVINLDIGHYTAGNQDAVAFIEEHHDRISHLHVKDWQKNHGPNVAWGTGYIPIVECLDVLRDNHYPIYALIEREYHGPNDGTPVEETKKDMDYMRQALLK